MGEAKKIAWTCISCSAELGEVVAGELVVLVPAKNARTRGVNLVLTCPKCGAEKVWYSSDPIVRAVYQLVDAITGVAARRMVEVTSRELMNRLEK